MTRKQQVSVIREAFNALPSMQDGWFDVAQRLLDMNIEQERRHRKGTPAGCTNHLPVNDAAKLFVVKNLLEGWEEPNRFSVDDILYIRNEILYAQAYAKRFHTELGIWAATYSTILDQVNYSELMNAA